MQHLTMKKFLLSTSLISIIGVTTPVMASSNNPYEEFQSQAHNNINQIIKLAQQREGQQDQVIRQQVIVIQTLDKTVSDKEDTIKKNQGEMDSLKEQMRSREQELLGQIQKQTDLTNAATTKTKQLEDQLNMYVDLHKSQQREFNANVEELEKTKGELGGLKEKIAQGGGDKEAEGSESKKILAQLRDGFFNMELNLNNPAGISGSEDQAKVLNYLKSVNEIFLKLTSQ
jgi:Rad3-related DNA helicase